MLTAKVRPGWHSAIQKYKWSCWLPFTRNGWAHLGLASTRGPSQARTRCPSETKNKAIV